MHSHCWARYLEGESACGLGEMELDEKETNDARLAENEGDVPQSPSQAVSERRGLFLVWGAYLRAAARWTSSKGHGGPLLAAVPRRSG